MPHPPHQVFTPSLRPQAFGSQILSSNIILPPSDEPHPKRARAKPSSGIMKFLDTRLSLRKVNSSPP